MIRALLSVVHRLRSAWLFELVGVALIVFGLYEAWGREAALVAGGLALVLKAYELDLRGDK